MNVVVNLSTPPLNAPSGLVGHPAPALAGLRGAAASSTCPTCAGSVVPVNVWAAWCAPCQDELPVLVATPRGLTGRGLRVAGVDTSDGQRQARELLARVGGDPAASVVDPSGRIAGG